MEPHFWRERWREDRIGFHLDQVNPILTRQLARVRGGKPGRVLVPFAGKSRDVAHLAKLGHQVVAVELVEDALLQLFRAEGLTPEREVIGEHVQLTARGIEAWAGDFFGLSPASLGTFDWVWDRAALIALPKEWRGRYADHLTGFLAPGAELLLVTVHYDDSRMGGPPFSVLDEEVHARFADHFRITWLESGDVLGDNERFRARGLEALHETCFHLVRLSTG